MRKRNLNESKKHGLLKKVSKRFLQKVFGVREEDIYEDFPIGDHIFDIIAYPKRSREGASKLSIISMECGKLNADDCISCLKKIADMLDFVDIVIWVPYSIYYNPFADIMMSLDFMETDKNNKVLFSTKELDLHKVPVHLQILPAEREIKNISVEEDYVAGLLFCKGEIYSKLKKEGQSFLFEK